MLDGGQHDGKAELGGIHELSVFVRDALIDGLVVHRVRDLATAMRKSASNVVKVTQLFLEICLLFVVGRQDQPDTMGERTPVLAGLGVVQRFERIEEPDNSGERELSLRDVHEREEN